jgi:hypothetical protein
MLADMARDHARVSIEAATRGETDDKTNRLPFVEILRARVGRPSEQNQADGD